MTDKSKGSQACDLGRVRCLCLDACVHSHPAGAPHLKQLPQGVICLAIVNVLDVEVAICQLVLLIPLVLQQQAELSIRVALPPVS